MAAYLYLNAFLYALFAVWVTISPWRTAAAVGFEKLSNSGKSEYLVVYGGMELGIAAFFAWTAWHAPYRKVGVVFALFFYAGIVLYRLATVPQFWPISSTTLILAALEITLLVWASVLLLRHSQGL
jgi:Domain of unknown function (DUF4345)